jgi:hypothetical protein
MCTTVGTDLHAGTYQRCPVPVSPVDPRLAAHRAQFGHRIAVLFRDTVTAAGGDGWRIMIEHATNGSYRVRAAAGRWLGNAAGLDVIREWVGGDADRARVVATHTGPDAHGLSPTARFLIAEFSTDEQIPWLLRQQLLPLSYSGGEAAMYQRVLDQIADTDFAESDPVARWLEETVDWLRDLAQAARRTVAP